jgi:hypothetical protein
MKNVLVIILTIISLSTIAHAEMKIAACGNGSAVVTWANAKGKWIGFSALTNSGKIIDVAPVKMPNFGIGGSKSFSFRGAGVTEVRSSTWKDFKKGLMVDRLDDTGWVRCK